MNPEQLKEMNEIKWWHQIELPVENGTVTTPGRDLSAIKLSVIGMPEDLTGKHVIDVGAWDGYFSFEAEKRGAEVLAIDTVMWKEGPTFDSEKNKEVHHTGKRGFNFAKKMLNSKVRSERVEVMDLDDASQYDLVLCLGILYHMKDPFGMCKKMFEITKEGGQLILETHIDCEVEGIMNKPMMRFYPDKECNNDPGTWWGPNPGCVIAMLKVVGFKEVKLHHLSNHRGIFHAFK